MVSTSQRRRASRTPPRLQRRLMTLRALEWFNIGWLGLVLLWWMPTQRGARVPADTWQRTVAYLPVAALLAVGGWYWHRKLHQIRDGRPLDDVAAILHRIDRVALWLLSAATAAGVLSWVTATGTVGDRGWATALAVFAWGEYINYFRVQLMHDTRADLVRLARIRRLRRSRLAVDLARWRARR